VTCLQARAEAQILTALAWHEAFQLASAVERRRTFPVQPCPALCLAPPAACPLAYLPACHYKLLQQQRQHAHIYNTHTRET
jgi:hypothetical protein